MDDVKVVDNLTAKASPIRIKDWEVKKLIGEEIVMVKVVWGGSARVSMMWELESRVKESYLDLFSPCNFQGRKCFKWGGSCNIPIFKLIFYLIIGVFICVICAILGFLRFLF